MYEIKVSCEFSSAHSLREYRGKCEELHGHNWKVELAVASGCLDKAGLVMDFKKLKQQLWMVLEKLDHKHLNEIVFFKKVNPTSENIARYIYDRVKRNLPAVKSVTVWESEKASATYYE